MLIQKLLLDLMQFVRIVHNEKHTEHKRVLSVLVPRVLERNAMVCPSTKLSPVSAQPRVPSDRAAYVKFRVSKVDDFVNYSFSRVVHALSHLDFNTAYIKLFFIFVNR